MISSTVSTSSSCTSMPCSTRPVSTAIESRNECRSPSTERETPTRPSPSVLVAAARWARVTYLPRQSTVVTATLRPSVERTVTWAHRPPPPPGPEWTTVTARCCCEARAATARSSRSSTRSRARPRALPSETPPPPPDTLLLPAAAKLTRCLNMTSASPALRPNKHKEC